MDNTKLTIVNEMSSNQSDSSSLTVSATQSGNNKDNNNQLATSQPPQSPSALSSSGDPMSFQLNSSLTLATLEKIKRFFFSKEEWQSYLLDKLDEEKRKKGMFNSILLSIFNVIL